MAITKNNINNLIEEEIKNVIAEGISDITYHFCSIDVCANILASNEILLTLSSNSSDAYDKKRLFYLSTQRSRSKEIGFAHKFSNCARIQLDGKKLSEKYGGRPIDYWGSYMGKQSYYRPENADTYGKGFSNSKRFHTNFEMEDRIFSYSPVIKNARDYIERIDILLINDGRNTERYNQEERFVRAMSGYSNKVFVYDNEDDFNSQTKNTVNDKFKEWKPFDDNTKLTYDDSKEKRIYDKGRDNRTYVRVISELLNVYTMGELSRNADREVISRVKQLLQNFGLSEFFNEVFSMLRSRFYTQPEESCSLLSNTTNAPIRRLNTETGNSQIANKIMSLGAFILRRYNVSNFNELRSKINSGEVSSLKEMAYPQNFSLETLLELPSYTKRVEYCNSRLNKIGSGSSRIVYQIDNEKVLKVAKNKKGIAQNQEEMQDWKQNYYSCFAKVYDASEDGIFLEMQAARKAKRSDFKRLTGLDFETVCKYIYYVHSWYSRRHDGMLGAAYKKLFDNEEFQNKIEYTTLYDLQSFMCDTQLEAVGDLTRLSSWGVVVEDGVEHLVLIDYGLTDDVASNYYHFVAQ